MRNLRSLPAPAFVLALIAPACVPTEPTVDEVAEVIVAPDSVRGDVGSVIRLVATARATNGQAMTGEPVQWMSTEPSVAGVDTLGNVTLLSAGTAEVRATSRGKFGRGKVVVDPARLTALMLTPTAVSLDSGATRQFAVSGTWSDGATRTPNVSWSATGGTITAAGLYRAGTVSGAFRVVARHDSSGLADTSAVTVSVPPAPAPTLTSLVLAPASVSLDSGATRQFSVSGTWSDGSTGVPPVTYSATGGTITTGGLYRAGPAAGTFRVIAQHTGGTRADTSAVTITLPAPPPSGLVNECASPQAGWVWCDDFDQDRLASYFEFEQASGAFARVSGVGNGASYGMRARWTAGQVSAGALHLALGRTPQSYFRPADAGTADYRELYWRVYVRNQAGWTGGGGDKLSRAMIFASSSSWAQAMIAHVWSGDTQASRDMLMVDPARGTDANGTLVTTRYNDFANLTWIGSVRGTTPLFGSAMVGTWYCIESHVRLNDAGQSNGVFELWINGTPEATRTGLNWVGSYNAYGLNAVFLENYWNAGSPAAQERYLDNFVVSTQRIGC